MTTINQMAAGSDDPANHVNLGLKGRDIQSAVLVLDDGRLITVDLRTNQIVVTGVDAETLATFAIPGPLEGLSDVELAEAEHRAWSAQRAFPTEAGYAEWQALNAECGRRAAQPLGGIAQYQAESR